MATTVAVAVTAPLGVVGLLFAAVRRTWRRPAKQMPNLEPAPRITLPTVRTRACPHCGEPMEFGIAHYCRPSRKDAA